MTPQRQLVIIEHQTLDITHHLGRALHNTHQSMQDGYPTRSPGDGNPGGGSITADRMIATIRYLHNEAVS